jgi:hypothetical protein
VFTTRLKEDSLVREALDESRVEFFLVTSTTFGRSLGVLLRFTAWVCIVGESTRFFTDIWLAGDVGRVDAGDAGARESELEDLEAVGW